MRLRGRVLTSVVLTCVVAGCSAVAVPGDGGPTRGPAPAFPFDGRTGALAERYAQLRAVDVCATHDVAAAERVTGAVAFVIRPRGGFDGCEIGLEDAGGDAFAYTSIEIGPAERGDGPPAAVDGREFPAVAPAADAEGRAECGYAAGPGSDLVVRGEVVDDPAASCALAADYLAAVLPRLDAPPRRADAGTSPAFASATADPCALLAAVVDPPQPDGIVLDGPRSCSDGEVTVEVLLAQVETGLRGRPALRGGRAEVVDESGENRTGGCSVARQVSDTTLLAPSQPYLWRETVAVTAPDCATARGHLDVVGTVLPGPATPAAGALTLGSLDGNPLAADVGAPFDPCAAVGWAGFPAAVRPPGLDPRPFPAPVDPDDAFRVGCDHVSDTIAAVVTWGPEDPAGDGEPVRLAGRPGREDARQGGCASSLELGAGFAGVITLVRAGDVEPCAVNRSVLEALAALVG